MTAPKPLPSLCTEAPAALRSLYGLLTGLSGERDSNALAEVLQLTRKAGIVNVAMVEQLLVMDDNIAANVDRRAICTTLSALGRKRSLRPEHWYFFLADLSSAYSRARGLAPVARMRLSDARDLLVKLERQADRLKRLLERLGIDPEVQALLDDAKGGQNRFWVSVGDRIGMRTLLANFKTAVATEIKAQSVTGKAVVKRPEATTFAKHAVPTMEKHFGTTQPTLVARMARVLLRTDDTFGPAHVLLAARKREKGKQATSS